MFYIIKILREEHDDSCFEVIKVVKISGSAL